MKYQMQIPRPTPVEGGSAEACGLYQEVVANDPSHALALNGLGAALCNLGRFKEAVSYLRRAIDLESDFPEARNNLGLALRDLGRNAQAEVVLRRAPKSRPTDVRINLNLGYALLFLGRSAEAATRSAVVLVANPGISQRRKVARALLYSKFFDSIAQRPEAHPQ